MGKVASKAKKTYKVFDELARIAAIIPYPLYWTDMDIVVLGANDVILDAVGGSRDKIIGKTPFDYYGPEAAQSIFDNCKAVIKEKKVMYHDEVIKDITTGKFKHFTGIRGPIFDEKGNVIGTIGTSVDITAQKEAEGLRIENEEQKIKIDEQEKFGQIANQLSHDIRSPLAAAKIWYESIRHKLTEEERVVGHNALERATDILNSGFVRYKSTEKDKHINDKKTVMMFLLLEHIVAEKRLEYQHQSIILTLICEPAAIFSFVSAKPIALKRMVSNIINNAIDALDNKLESQVIVRLSADKKNITLSVEDNGKGIPEEVKEKILNQTLITFDKVHGNGIGFTQVWNTIQDSNATLLIDSKVGVGTQVNVVFPRRTMPNWMTDHISLLSDDLVVVVDDDSSIHDAWETRFHAIAPTMFIKHFHHGEEAKAFLASLPNPEKVFLLSDYELLNQSLNGLDLIEESKIARTLLVTSHADNPSIQARALALNTRILPKQLVANIAIEIQAVTKNHTDNFVDTEVVIMDDDRTLLDSIVSFVFSKRKVETYTRPQDCLAKLDSYAKETVFFIDHYYGTNRITGMDVAQKLHEHGFHHLYLLTGDDTKKSVPDYLTVIIKTDTERLKAIADKCFEAKFNTSSVPQENKSIIRQQKTETTPELVNTLLKHLSHEILNSLSIIQINADLVKLIEESEDKTSEEIKKGVLERVENIRQSQKECAQILSMEIAKIRALYSLNTNNQRSSIKRAIETALSDYVFRKGEREKIFYDGTTFDYYGDAEIMKQLLFHIIRQGLQAIKEYPQGQLKLSCVENQLIVRYTEELSDEENFENVEAKLSEIFYQSAMTKLGGHIEHDRTKDMHKIRLCFLAQK
jgi:PAS domain S-box-containing protein